jgi:hypothetical protein
MPQPESKKSFTFDRPRKYRIRIQGFLDESWSDRLGGMSIKTPNRGDHEQVTTLIGLLVDQAALAGVLSTLYELHLTLLSVEYLEDEKVSKGKPIEKKIGESSSTHSSE